MSCKDCVHYEACKGTYYEVKEQGEFDGEMYAQCGCDDFKNKADFVEVVECSNCKYAHFNKAVCAYSCKRRDYYSEFVKPTDFCSYGEKRTIKE